MLYNDDVYGSVEIEEEVLIDLINSKPMQRLKGISQSGLSMFNPVYSEVKSTRFDHSIGVLIILKKFNASIEEQIGGLLHDVSHTVFSHVTDFLFNRPNHDYHEEFHEKIILDSEIPTILEKHGIGVNNVLDEKKFTLLEKELPDLCADRIDYYFRDMFLHNKISKSDINRMFDAMEVFNGEIVFNNKNTAKFFAEKYIEANKLYWCSLLQVSLFKLLSDSMRLGISKKIITEDDLFTTDKVVYEKLKNSNDKEIINLIDSILNMNVIEDKNDYDFHLKSKVRWVDPKIISNGKIIRLSEMDASYKKQMKDYIDSFSKGFFVKFHFLA